MEENVSCSQGQFMYGLVERLFGICRSITGNGVRETLKGIAVHLPNLEIHEVPSGTKCCDWLVPDEWNIRDAHISDEQGRRIVDFQQHNLHVVGYSSPVDKEVSREELDKHLFSLPELPDAIPYVTSYYKTFWGFCLTENQRKTLTDPHYRVVIDSSLTSGSLTYADLVVPGESKEEVFFSTYTCHPSMANNELSGPALATCLGKWISSQSNRYTYRFVFAPETIGPLVYLSRNLEHLRTNTIAAFNLSCVGDNLAVSYIPSKSGDTLTDRVAQHVLKHRAPGHLTYEFVKHRGSDERQYCSPGVDLPMVSIMRSRYGDYPGYHNSLDNLDLVSPEGFQTSFDLHKECITVLESNRIYASTIIGEPQLSRRGLVQSLGGGIDISQTRVRIQNILMFCDGSRDLIDVAEVMEEYVIDLLPVIETLKESDLLVEILPVQDGPTGTSTSK
jgi:aminopeptidase-like protein